MGHFVGDEILRKVSNAFYDNVRSCDYVFRYGGDEFVIVLTEASEVDTLRIAERIRARGENKYQVTYGRQYCTFVIYWRSNVQWASRL